MKAVFFSLSEKLATVFCTFLWQISVSVQVHRSRCLWNVRNHLHGNGWCVLCGEVNIGSTNSPFWPGVSQWLESRGGSLSGLTALLSSVQHSLAASVLLSLLVEVYLWPFQTGESYLALSVPGLTWYTHTITWKEFEHNKLESVKWCVWMDSIETTQK